MPKLRIFCKYNFTCIHSAQKTEEESQSYFSHLGINQILIDFNISNILRVKNTQTCEILLAQGYSIHERYLRSTLRYPSHFSTTFEDSALQIEPFVLCFPLINHHVPNEREKQQYSW